MCWQKTIHTQPWINWNSSSIVKLNAKFFESKVVCVWSSANTYKKNISNHFFSFTILYTFNRHSNFAVFFLSAGDFGIQFEFQSLLSHNSLKLLTNIHINAHASNVTHEFNSSNLRAQP